MGNNNKKLTVMQKIGLGVAVAAGTLVTDSAEAARRPFLRLNRSRAAAVQKTDEYGFTQSHHKAMESFNKYLNRMPAEDKVPTQEAYNALVMRGYVQAVKIAKGAPVTVHELDKMRDAFIESYAPNRAELQRLKKIGPGGAAIEDFVRCFKYLTTSPRVNNIKVFNTTLKNGYEQALFMAKGDKAAISQLDLMREEAIRIRESRWPSVILEP